ncbi:hypothetical protein PVT71_15220 [Salipiger sp. H15]|uniref:Uncharacterized protein n=1 Tax=Alloyangia sp. H15 TaxID=3029062 RepID=A0AAU8AMW5_9RHOB
MPRFSAPAARPSYGSGFDRVAMRDTFADFRAWWDRSCLLAETPAAEVKPASLPMAA